MYNKTISFLHILPEHDFKNFTDVHNRPFYDDEVQRAIIKCNICYEYIISIK